MAKGKYQEWLTEDGLTMLRGWARDGLTDKQIADKIGIRRETLYAWRKAYPNISNALKRGKDVVDMEAEETLIKSWMGYDYWEEVQELRFNRESGRYEMQPTKKVRKHQPPNVAALIFWLKNRQPGKWREKSEGVDDRKNESIESFLKAMRPPKEQLKELFDEGDDNV